MRIVGGGYLLGAVSPGKVREGIYTFHKGIITPLPTCPFLLP